MNDDNQYIEDYLNYQLAEEREVLLMNNDLIEHFVAFCNSKGIVLTINNFQYIPKIGIVANYPMIAHVLHKMDIDKEGLLDFRLLESQYSKHRLMPGLLRSENYFLMAHSCFRRGFSAKNNFRPSFIEIFWNYEDSKNQKYIALDPDRVRINMNHAVPMEFDTWFGARFRKEIVEIEDGISKLIPPPELTSTDIRCFFDNTSSLDIKWSSKEGVKVFQAEEFKQDDCKITKDGVEYFPARYLHAEYDLEKQVFRHFDGALHFYTMDEYYQRRDKDFNYNNKFNSQVKPNSHKMFKINGQVSALTWTELTTHYLSGNPLILEYFEGELPINIQELRLIRQRHGI